MHWRNPLVFCVFMAGCVSMNMGKPFNYDAALQLKEGATKEEVRTKVGDPWVTSASPGGVETWMYMNNNSTAVATPLPFYTHVQSSGSTQSISIYFKDGKLTADPFGASRFASSGNVTIGKPFNMDGVKFLSNGSSREEARAAIGEPFNIKHDAGGKETWTYMYGPVNSTTNLVLEFVDGKLIK